MSRHHPTLRFNNLLCLWNHFCFICTPQGFREFSIMLHRVLPLWKVTYPWFRRAKRLGYRNPQNVRYSSVKSLWSAHQDLMISKELLIISFSVWSYKVLYLVWKVLILYLTWPLVRGFPCCNRTNPIKTQFMHWCANNRTVFHLKIT